MARVKRAVHARKKKNAFFKAAKGYRGGRSRLLRTVKEAVDRARCYAYRDRKVRKRDFRSLWIVRINAAARICGMTYSALIHGLKLANVEMDRKTLANLAISDFDAFKSIADTAKAKL
ncbi:MAG: 50S ribosomal protein L20 [SAR324 cluster bacterium]|uniref:Large ribosomal subunit protein bL20 n=1 Tax=SAR324 cluster bacterium TaxID=2024889 RepID=A0A2A4T716_9DELT|nr:MAG: 50S ribosomal protein L20 [SAR324 cluster bacterium]